MYSDLILRLANAELLKKGFVLDTLKPDGIVSPGIRKSYRLTQSYRQWCSWIAEACIKTQSAGYNSADSRHQSSSGSDSQIVLPRHPILKSHATSMMAYQSLSS